MKTASIEILEKALLPPPQAHAILKIVELEITSAQEQLATKADLWDTEAVLKADLLAAKTELKGEISAARTELKDEISAVRTELKDEISSVRTELKDEVSSVRTELKDEISAVRTELKDEINALRVAMNRSEGRLSRWVLTCMLGQTAVLAGFGYFALTHLVR
ncbi:MAG TPA: coiled-coil domain-containing protein [Opitutaceae bacterium]|nr:coiled-coil domain-containing protein [Opitutaceae bacterium]